MMLKSGKNRPDEYVEVIIDFGKCQTLNNLELHILKLYDRTDCWSSIFH